MKPKEVRRYDAGQFPNQSPQQASSWKAVTEWKKEDVPAFPGSYEIRYAPNGIAAKTAWSITSTTTRNDGRGDEIKPEVTQSNIEHYELDGLLYIGKTVSFADRFWLLITTWRRDNRRISKSNHGSYNHWLEDELMDVYPIRDLQFRFIPRSAEVWKPEISTDTDAMRARLLNQNVNDSANLASGSAISAEEDKMQKYLSFFGRLPILNRDGRSPKMDSDELDVHLDELEQLTILSPQEQEAGLEIIEGEEALETLRQIRQKKI